MLQEAHIGIGVKGREGSQAAQASDFAIPRFRSLIPLLAVQGYWANNRMTNVAILMLYKNFAMIAVYFWSSLDTLQSPTDFYDQFCISFFNLLFTLLPPVAYGFWERNARKCDLLKYPELYHLAPNPMHFPRILIAFAIGLWQSIVVYYTVRLAGPEEPLQTIGNLSYICIVLVIAVEFLYWAADWNGWQIGASVLTAVLLVAVFLIYAYISTPALIGMLKNALGKARGWLIIILSLAGAIAPCVAGRFFWDYGWPDLLRLIRERESIDKPGTLEFDELLKSHLEGADATTATSGEDDHVTLQDLSK
jgi:magnesium-transporting ATPase (P-type)